MSISGLQCDDDCGPVCLAGIRAVAPLRALDVVAACTQGSGTDRLPCRARLLPPGRLGRAGTTHVVHAGCGGLGTLARLVRFRLQGTGRRARLVCLVDPWAPLAPGFWLSFGAVALLLLAAHGRGPKPALAVDGGERTGRDHRWTHPAHTGTVWAGVAGGPARQRPCHPDSELCGHAAVVTGGRGTHRRFCHPRPHLYRLAGRVSDMAGWIRGRGLAPRRTSLVWTVGLAVAGVLFCLAPLRLALRLQGLVWLLPMLLWPAPRPQSGDLWLTVLDVGQGLSIVARTGEHALLYDTGPRYSPDADGGNRVILPYLRGEGVERLDAMVVTHDDNDHTGGAQSVLDGVAVAQLLTSLSPDHPCTPATHLATPVRPVSTGPGKASASRSCTPGQPGTRRLPQRKPRTTLPVAS